MTEQEKNAVDKAYAACAHKVDDAAGKLEKWYLSYSDEPTEKAASELLGWKAKWKVVAGSKEDYEAHSNEVISKHLFSEKDEKKQLEYQMSAVLLAWQNVEDELAVETNCPALSSEAKGGTH